MARGAGAAERREWTAAERKKLLDLWDSHSVTDISLLTGRSRDSVKNAARRFGLEKHKRSSGVFMRLSEETYARLAAVASHHGTTPNRLARSIIEARFTTPLPKR